MIGRVQAGVAADLREGLRVSDANEFVRFVKRQMAEQRSRVSPELQRAAQQEIGPGGFWSPEETADRIMNFVRKWAGDDQEKLRIAHDAVMKGFAEAEKILGVLPEISQKTREIVSARFQELMQER